MVDVLDFRPVRPIRSFAGYVGGKRLLAPRLVERISAVPHRLYAEAFVGAGGVFFKRAAAPKVEAINDLNGDIATLFRVLQEHFGAFMDMLQWKLASRAEYERLMGLDPERLTDLQRAARFLFLQRLAFGGKVTGRSFGISMHEPARFDARRIGVVLEAVHERLGGVYIERLPWAEFLRRWDRPETLFFLDPPYWGTEHVYGAGLFERAEFARLAEALKGLRGRFILTLNDVPEIRELFAWAVVEPVELTYTVSRGAGTAARELIISGGGS